MRQVVPVIAGMILILGSGVAHGWLTGRWGPTADMADCMHRLQSIPLNMGDWEGERQALRDAADLGNVAGYFHARYVNRRDGSALSVFLLGGPPGPVAIHTPDACYPASGYEIAAQRHLAVGASTGPAGEFWLADLVKTRAADESRVRVLWSWSATGRWSVPESPRLTFARYPVLYKLYIVRELSPHEESAAADPALSFLAQLLPQLQQRLFNAA